MRIPVLLPLSLIAAACSRTPALPAPGGDASPVAASTAVPAGIAPALEARIRARIAQEEPGEVAVALADLETGLRIGIDDGTAMHAASTMKVPVLVELFRQAASGRYSLDDSVRVKAEFTSIADGSTYSLSPESDSEHALYALVGRKTTLRDLAYRMITRSSNLATNILIERVTADSVRRTMDSIGAGGMRVLRGVEDIPAFRRGMNNTTTAAGLAAVLEAVARCEAGPRFQRPGRTLDLPAGACGEITAILADQEFTEMIPAGVPAGVRVANKTGWITGIQHDGAVVYPPGRSPYVLVVLTRGITDRPAAADVVSDISRMVWEELGARGKAAPARDPEARALLERHARYRVDGITEREFTHREYWSLVGPLVDASPVLEREEIGRSIEGRPLYLVRYGSGPTRVLLWSQMHGDESTATMALADLFRFLDEEADSPLARRLAERLTILLVPLLNPDGAERFQRRNAQGIDVNRDARRLVTPEGRALKAMQERFRPDFGFNLHDQNVRTRVGTSDRLAAIALLAPAFDASRQDNPGRLRAKRVATVVGRAMEPLVSGHIARYDDTFNPRAFGDLMQSWGVSTVLIESGGWRGDPEKQHLRAANFTGILAALDAIAGGTYATADPGWYESLPENGSSVRDLLVRGGTLVLPGMTPYRADLAVNFGNPLERRGGRVVDAGDLAGFDARDTLDVAGLFLHPTTDRMQPGTVTGTPASFVARRGPEPASEAVWRIEEGVATPAAGRAP